MARSRSVSHRLKLSISLADLPLAWVGVLVAGCLAVLWFRNLWQTYLSYGLFAHGLGDDFANYYAQSRALWSGDPSAIYRLDALQSQLFAVASYMAPAAEPPVASSVPYPAIFAWLFTPFTWPVPPVGLLLWTIANLF